MSNIKGLKYRVMLDNNQKSVSVAETSYTSEENSTTRSHNYRATREIASGVCTENKVRGMQIQSRLTNYFPNKNITYKNKVVLQEVHSYTYYVLVTGK